MGFGTDNAVMREAVAASPLRPMPLAVLAHGRPFALPDDAPGFTAEELEAILRRRNEDLATLVPNARFTVATESGHDIHQDQPELVIEAIRQVVAGVRNPDTWYDCLPAARNDRIVMAACEPVNARIWIPRTMQVLTKKLFNRRAYLGV